MRCAQQCRMKEALLPTAADRCLHVCSIAVQNMFKPRVGCLCCVCCSPNVRVRVSLGGTSPKLLAMALDILGAVVPCPAPGPSTSPKSAEGAPERVVPAVGDGKLPAGPKPVSEFSQHVICKHALSHRAQCTWTTTRLSMMCKKSQSCEMKACTHLACTLCLSRVVARGNHPKAMRQNHAGRLPEHCARERYSERAT